MSAPAYLLLPRSQRMSPQESALEQGWLLSEMERCFSYSLDELARRFDRSISWVSRRLALVELLPDAVQRHVREGNIAAQIAMKYLVPVARVSAEDCERIANVFVKHRCDARQAAQLYTAWREGSRVVRARILTEPELFLKTQRQPQTAKAAAAEQVERDLEMALAILRRAGPQAQRSFAGDECRTAGAGATRDRKCAPGTEPDGGTNRKGTGSQTC